MKRRVKEWFDEQVDVRYAEAVTLTIGDERQEMTVV